MLIAQMILVYTDCGMAAKEAGQKTKEAMYRKKVLEAAGAISKIWGDPGAYLRIDYL